MTIVAVMGTRRCRGGTRNGTHAPTNRCTNTSTPAASCDRTDYGSGAGADQPSPERSLGGVVGVRERGGRQHQTGADHTGDSRLLSHFPNSLCYGANTQRAIKFRSVALPRD